MRSSLSALTRCDADQVRFDGPVLNEQNAGMIAESIPHIVWTASPDGATTYFNRRGTDYTGCPQESHYEWNWVTLVHPDDAEQAARAWRHAILTGTSYALEYRIRRFDGSFDGVPSAPFRIATTSVRSTCGSAPRPTAKTRSSWSSLCARSSARPRKRSPSCRVSRRLPQSDSPWWTAI